MEHGSWCETTIVARFAEKREPGPLSLRERVRVRGMANDLTIAKNPAGGNQVRSQQPKGREGLRQPGCP
jgi:hypothetical protein